MKRMLKSIQNISSYHGKGQSLATIHDIEYPNEEETILKPGVNCWVNRPADRVSFLIDAAPYYQALQKALLNAKKSVYITGWDIKTYTLIRDPDHPDKAIKLIDLLNKALDRNPELHIYIFCWKWTVLFIHDRECFARLKWKIKGHNRLHFKLDSTHPLGGSHHQKLVIIDDAMAFCGGIDLTDERWDTQKHEPKSYHRKNSDGDHYRPHHDIQIAFDGPAVRDLASLFRGLWENSTGEKLPEQHGLSAPWPRSLSVDFHKIKLAISRTVPWQNYEVIHMFRDAILSAKKYIYIENQYFSWSGAFEALSSKLMDPEGPEIIIVLPRSYTGRLEKIAIGKLTAHLIESLRAIDFHNRLAVYYPKICHVKDYDSVKVHSKFLAIDNKFIKCGSANFSNRSMCVDTECDVAIESNGDKQIEAKIESLVFDLLAEHHGCDKEQIKAESKRCNSILQAINNLRDGRPRRLEPIQFPTINFKKNRSLFYLVVDPPAPWLYMLKHWRTSLRYWRFLDRIRKLGCERTIDQRGG